MFSSRNLLSGFSEHLASPLVPDAAGHALRAIAAQLPVVGSSQYVELRLGEHASPRVDFLIAVSRLQRELVQANAATYRALGPGLSPLCRTLERWTNRESSLYEAVPMLWLEFDDVERQSALSANLCATVAPSYLEPLAPIVSLAHADLPAILFEVLELARGNAPTASERDTLTRCVQGLPAGSHWLHLSVMTARSPQVVKLYGVFPAGTAVAYLRGLGWGGDLARIERLLSRSAEVDGAGGEVYLDLCVSELSGGHGYSLGICFSKQRIRPADPRRGALIEFLLAERLCTSAQAVALADWPAKVALGAGAERRHFLERWFEIKLVYHSAEALSAKAYLGFAASAGQLKAAESQGIDHQRRI